jgi:hypothetical protein
MSTRSLRAAGILQHYLAHKTPIAIGGSPLKEAPNGLGKCFDKYSVKSIYLKGIDKAFNSLYLCIDLIE